MSDNKPMNVSPRRRRIERAKELAEQHAFAAEILGFYIHVAQFQDNLHDRLAKIFPAAEAQSDLNRELGISELAGLVSGFESFLTLAETRGPQPLIELSRELRGRGPSFWSDVLRNSWLERSASDSPGVLASAFLQPYAELLRSRAARRPALHANALCPFCNRKPGLGVLRQMGDGGARSLVCSFCLAEWEFRRILCPGCGEEKEQHLPVFTAADFDYIRVECCDTCKTYIKTIELTKDGHAEPVVDELASAPLDLWARDRGYAKLQNNILGM